MSDTDDQGARDFAKELFARANADDERFTAREPDPTPPDPAKGNVVPHEGNTPKAQGSGGMRDFVRGLFNNLD